MSKRMTNMASLLVLALYIIANTGVGIHVCTMDRTRDIVPLFNGLSCEDVHSHEGCHHHCSCPEDCSECGHAHFHSSGCCSSDILVITDEQESCDDFKTFSPAFTGLVQNYDISAFICDGLNKSCFTDSSPDKGIAVLQKSAARRL